MNKQVKKLVKDLEAQGWRTEFTGSGHIKAMPPDREHSPVIIPCSPSDHRSLKNCLSNIRHRGGDV